MSSLPVQDIVNVTINVSALPPSQESFSGGLIVGSSARLALGERVKKVTKDTYPVLFQATDPEYLAAQKYFGQSPAPTSLYIGRRFASAQGGYLSGGIPGNGAAVTLTALQAITSGDFDVTVDSTTIHVTTLNLSGAATLAAVATLIQTQLNAGLTGTTCVYNATNGVFEIHSPTTGTSSQVSYATPPTGESTDTAALLLGFHVDAGASRVVGIAAESTITDSLNALKAFSGEWYTFAPTRDTTLADLKLAAAWAEANEKPMFCTTNSPLAYSAADGQAGQGSGIAGFCKLAGYSQTFVMYSTDSPEAAVSAMGRINPVDYNQPNSTITLWGKQLPGVKPDPIDATKKAGLEANNCNYYATFGTFTMLANGCQASGRFTDEVIGLAWLKSTVQGAAFTVMATTPTKIPQTDPGVFRVQAAIEQALDKGVSNGLLAPGVWPATNAQVGETKPGDMVERGYYVYAQPVALQSLQDRAARIAPPISGIAIGAGALQHVNVTINFQR